ncbi:Zinc finger A20 and AN1 domain-containing stress-associated protein 4 [Glycine max]|nr:Zinc finger A20 and AN1 domain-containing stress-associated protein 4 [Glycine max]
MAEEHRCQAPCFYANNCSFFGSPTTQNMCSKCYCNFQLKEQQSSNTKMVLNQFLVPLPPSAVISQSLSFSTPAADLASKVVLDAPHVAEKTHRYPKKHACEFDFKKMGREQIAKANPVVKGKKLEKI